MDYDCTVEMAFDGFDKIVINQKGENMNLQEIKYDAFISYRHCELDQFVATTLHKELEAFRLPKAIARQLKAKGITKKKIERVFRDRDELPITNNLADPITNALQNSDFLLVICSPRLRESLWCRKEIETFIKMHGREHVFAVLIEGEPADSFPEELLYVEKVTVDENGKEHLEKIPVEPLAADVRGKNKREIHKKIKEEVLRLAAPMFDCSYDDLKQRHRERAIRRIVTIAGSISAVFAAFGIVSSVMAYQINEQSVQIKEQSVQIQEQADKIHTQYQEALRTNAKQMAEDAFDLIERGDMDLAKETAYQALAGEMPYTPEAEYALSSALQVYRNGSQIAPKRLLKLDSQVDFCKASPDKAKLMVVDIFGNINVYNPVSGEKLYTVNSNDAYLAENAVGFLDDTTIFYPVDNGLVLYNLETKQKRDLETDYASCFTADKSGKYILSQSYDEVFVYDTDSLQSIFKMENESETSFTYDAMFSRGNQDMAVVTYEKDDFAGVSIIDIQTQEAVNYLTDKSNISSMWVEDEYIYLAAYSGHEIISGSIYCITPDGKLVWEHTLEGLPDDIMAYRAKTSDVIAFTQYSRLVVLSKENGTVICETDSGREIKNYACYIDTDTICYMTRDGEFHYLLIDMNTDMVVNDKFITNSDNLQEFIFGKEYYVSSTYMDNAVAIYEYIRGEDVTELVDGEEIIYGCRVSPDEKYLVYSSSDNSMLIVIDLEKKEVVRQIATGSTLTDYAITDENEIMVLHWDSVQGYDLLSGELLFERKTETSNEYFVRNGEAYVGDELLNFFMCDTKTGEVLFTMEGNHLLQDGMLTSEIEENGEYYAYASEEEAQLVIGSFETGDTLSLDVNINAIKTVNLAMQEKTVYLSYLDNTVEVYDMVTGEYIRGYDTLSDIVDDVEELEDGRGTLMLVSDGAYLLNAEKEMIAYIQGYEGYRKATDSFILSNSSVLYEVPYYDTAELMNMAE